MLKSIPFKSAPISVKKNEVFMLNSINMIEIPITKSLTRSPVSYTHLDVYKRQDLHSDLENPEMVFLYGTRVEI